MATLPPYDSGPLEEGICLLFAALVAALDESSANRSTLSGNFEDRLAISEKMLVGRGAHDCRAMKMIGLTREFLREEARYNDAVPCVSSTDAS